MTDLEIVVEMACSINGIIADEKGKEDFLSYRGWEIMIEFMKEYDVLIWGRKTFESVITWGKSYVEDLKSINIIVLGNNKKVKTDLNNVFYCSSIEECLDICRKNNFKKIFVSGGANTNNSFLCKNIVDKIILNYNPFVLSKGKSLFEGEYFENKLELEKVIKEKEDILQVHYKIKKN